MNENGKQKSELISAADFQKRREYLFKNTVNVVADLITDMAVAKIREAYNTLETAIFPDNNSSIAFNLSELPDSLEKDLMCYKFIKQYDATKEDNAKMLFNAIITQVRANLGDWDVDASKRVEEFVVISLSIPPKEVKRSS